MVFVTPDGFSADPARALALTQAALAGGAAVVQIRDRCASEERLRSVTRKLAAELAAPGRLMVNGPSAIRTALSVPGVGVHIRECDIELYMRDALASVTHCGRVACSVHSVEAAVRAMRLGPPDHIQVGTMFETGSHPEKKPEGPGLLRSVRQAVGSECTLIGVGGVTEGNARHVIEAGADGVAVISAISTARDPESATIKIVNAVSRAQRASSP